GRRRSAGALLRQERRSVRGRRQLPRARGRYPLRARRHARRARDRARGPRRFRQSQSEGRGVPVLSDPRISPFGDGALLVELGDRIDDTLAVRARALADAWDAAGEGRAIPAYASVVVRIVAPRLPRPRERVPAGSVAVADGQTSVYPFDSPGGWRLIGRTDVRVFDSMRDPPVLIRPGDRVRFVAR